MATVSASTRLNPGAIRVLMTSPSGPMARALLRRGLLVESQAKRNLGGIGGPKRVDTGRLRASITTQLVQRNGTLWVIIGTNVSYARFVHNGTGIYGAAHREIRPRRAKFLRFRSPTTRRWVFARKVKGMPANPFLLNALPAARG